MQLHQVVVVLDRQYVHWGHKVGACIVNEDVDLTKDRALAAPSGQPGSDRSHHREHSAPLHRAESSSTRALSQLRDRGTNCQTRSLLHQLARHNQTKSARTTRKQHRLACEIVLTFAPRSHHRKHDEQRSSANCKKNKRILIIYIEIHG